MAKIHTFLRVIYGKEDLCCLCLQNPQNELISFADDIIICNTNMIKVGHLLTCVLGEQFKQNISSLEWICRKCIEALVFCYNFIQSCCENIKKMNKLVENVYNFLDKENDIKTCEPLYIYFDTEDNIINYNTDLYINYCDLENMTSFLEDKTIPELQLKQDNDIHNTALNKKTKIVNSIKAQKVRCNDDRNTYRCKLCLQAYSRAENLLKHYYRAHAAHKYKCLQCPKKYGTSLMLKEHVNTSHCSAICSHCGKVYSSKGSLKSHEKSHIVRHVCKHCGKVYKTNISFKQHVQSSCGKNKNLNTEEKFTCDYCGKQYTQKSGIRVHMQFEHGNWKCYVCEWCNKKYHSASKLKEHIVTHTKDKKFDCEFCGGTFVSKRSLLYHTRTHTGVKPYKCTYCDQSFLSASRRSTHINYHHTPEIVECDVCCKKFKGKAYLVKHRKRHFDPNSRLHCGVELAIN